MNLIFMYHAMNDDVTIDVLRRVGRDYNYTTIFISYSLYLHNILIEPPDSCPGVWEPNLGTRRIILSAKILTRSFLLENLA